MLYSIAKTAYERGVIWVCAAGNQVETVVAPAIYPGTIAVAATNPNDDIWEGSSYGTAVDIAAPGEDVYVPFQDHKGNDNMVFGSGTSYATPHIAAAAALWKAKHSKELKSLAPWKVVELFRECLKASANTQAAPWSNGVGAKKFGAGILDVEGLLEQKINFKAKGRRKKGVVEVRDLTHAYKDLKRQPSWDLGVREFVHFLWHTARRKIIPGFENYQPADALTKRAKISMSAMTGSSAPSSFESYGDVSTDVSEKLLRVYFESFSKKATP